jgi:hypothetical protein
MLPGVMIPDPPLKIGIRLEVLPAGMVAGEGVKLLIDGGATTATVKVLVAELPAAFVTVSVYVVVVSGAATTPTPLVIATLPGVTTPVPPEKTPVSVVEVPDVIVAELAVKLQKGAATTVTVTACVVLLPTVFVTVNV